MIWSENEFYSFEAVPFVIENIKFAIHNLTDNYKAPGRSGNEVIFLNKKC